MSRTAKAEGAWFRHTDLVRKIVVGLDLTRRQHRIYEVLLELALPPGSPNAGSVLRGPDGVNRGRPPTNVLVSELSGVPRQHVAGTLDELVAKGLVRRTDGGGLEVVSYEGITGGSATEWVAKLVGQHAAAPDSEAAAEPKGQDAGQPETAEALRRREWDDGSREGSVRPAVDLRRASRRLDATGGLSYLSVIANRGQAICRLSRRAVGALGVDAGEADGLVARWAHFIVPELVRAHERLAGIPAEFAATGREVDRVVRYAVDGRESNEVEDPGTWSSHSHRPRYGIDDVPTWEAMVEELRATVGRSEAEGRNLKPVFARLMDVVTSPEVADQPGLSALADVDPDDFRGGDEWECEAEPPGTEDDG